MFDSSSTLCPSIVFVSLFLYFSSSSFSCFSFSFSSPSSTHSSSVGFTKISPVVPFIAIKSFSLNTCIACFIPTIAGISWVLAIIDTCEFVPPSSVTIPAILFKSNFAVSEVVISFATIMVLRGK